MKRTMFAIGIVVLMMVISLGCNSVKPGFGEEAVLIMQPVLFGHGGVDPTPVKAGQEWVAPTTHEIIVDMKPMQFDEHFEDLMSSDGVPLDFDAALRLRITDSVRLVSAFGPEWYKSNVKAEYRNKVRQAVRKHGLNETAIDTKAIEIIDDEVSNGMTAYLKTAQLPIELIGVTVGKANPPDAVKNQRIRTAEEQQRALTEDQRKLAEDKRLAAEKSRAAADNAYRNAMTLTTDMFIQLEMIKMQHEVCKDGHCTFIVGQTPGVVLPINPAKK